MDDLLAIILGGGRGTRLFPLTLKRSKPAVPIGGKYRLIDIPISNCLNAGLRHIFVLTQFNSESLNTHIAMTYKFDVFSSGFVTVLAAEQTEEGGDWFQGTADAVRQGRDQVRGLPFLVPRAADGLAVDGDHEPAAGLHRPGVQPGTENPVEHIGADQCEGTPEGGLLRRAARRAQYGQHLRSRIGGPLPDRGERPRSRDHRRDPHGQQPGQRVPAPAPLPRVRDLGKEIEQVLAAGSRDR